jgi:hypothetical protein
MDRGQLLLLGASILLVGACVFAVHRPALWARALCFDDDQYLTQNHLVKNPSWAHAGQFHGDG